MVTRLDAHRDEFHRGQTWKRAVDACTTGNVTISTALNVGDVVDGVTLTAGMRVLVPYQTSGSQNGIYDAGATPARSYDMDEGLEARGALVHVVAGTVNGGTLWRNTNTGTIAIDTTALTFVQVASGVDLTAIDFLVGTATGLLSGEIAVGTTPGGELGGTWASPTVDATHSGSAHFVNPMTTPADLIVGDTAGAPARLAKGADSQVLTVDPTTHLLVWATPSGGGSGTLTTIEEVDGNPTDNAVTKLVFPNGSLVIAAHVATYTPPAAAAAVYAFPLDVPPGSAHAKDDEFEDATGQSGAGNGLDAKWTDPLSSGAGLTLTRAFANKWLNFEPATSGTASTGKHMFGIRQAAPTGSFTISCRMAGGHAYSNDDTGGGIFMARTTGTKLNTIGWYAQSNSPWRAIGAATYSESADAGGYDGFVVDAGYVNTDTAWYKMVWDAGAGTIAYYASVDGADWILLNTRSSQSQPDRIGLCLYGNGGTIKANHRIFVKWFRVTEP
jgi:hypothetical protein